jgi:hypothetical protein
MLKLAALQTALRGLVGLRPHYNPGLSQYSPDLLECRSMQFLNDTHPLISPENLIAALPKTVPQDVPIYIGGKHRYGYVMRDAELHIFICIKDGEDEPLLNEEYWLPTDLVSAKLRQLIDAAAVQVATAVVQQKKVEGAKSVISEAQLYHGAGNINQRIIKEGRFCGLEIVVKPERDFVIRLSRFGLQSDTPNPNLNLYLYHSSQSTPIRVIPTKFTSSGLFSWASVPDIYLTLNDETLPPGGRFLIGYYEDDITGQIVDKQKDWTNAQVMTCGMCNPQESADFNTWSKYMEFHPFTVSAIALQEDRTLWNLQRNNYNYFSNYGINLTVALECDLTQFLVRHEDLLSDAIAKQAAVNILRVYLNTNENDGLAEKCRQHAIFQLTRGENRQPSMIDDADKAVATLALDIVDEDSPCLPKYPAKKNRISHKAI